MLCDDNVMTFTASGTGFTHLLVDRGKTFETSYEVGPVMFECGLTGSYGICKCGVGACKCINERSYFHKVMRLRVDVMHIFNMHEPVLSSLFCDGENDCSSSKQLYIQVM